VRLDSNQNTSALPEYMSSVCSEARPMPFQRDWCSCARTQAKLLCLFFFTNALLTSIRIPLAWFMWKMLFVGCSFVIGPKRGLFQRSSIVQNCAVRDFCALKVCFGGRRTGSGSTWRVIHLWYGSYGVTSGPMNSLFVGMVGENRRLLCLVHVRIDAWVVSWPSGNRHQCQVIVT